MRTEPTNNRTAGIDTNHSTMLTLLLDLNVISEQRWIQFELQNSPSRVLHLMANLLLSSSWLLNMKRLVTLKQQRKKTSIT